MVRGVAFVPIVLFWAGVAFVLHVAFRIRITSGPSARPSSLYFKTGPAKYCSRRPGCLSTYAEVEAGRISSHCDADERNYIRLACDAVPT